MCVCVCVFCVCACVCVNKNRITMNSGLNESTGFMSNTFVNMADRESLKQLDLLSATPLNLISQRKPNMATPKNRDTIVQELCESRGGRPGLSVLTSLLVSVDVKNYCTVLRH